MTDTLSYHRARPFLRSLDLSGVPVSAVASKWEDFQKMLKDEEGAVAKSPEEDALWFYMMNHAMAEVSQKFEEFEPLCEFDSTVNLYHNMMQVKSLRMFYYLLMITMRESRHAMSNTGLSALYEEYPEVKKFHMAIRGSNESAAVAYFTSNPPDMKLGRFCEFVRRQFTEAGFGSSYGGKPWANVAKCLSEFVSGKLTAEMMMDTAFTLSHNNGPIFNKGMVFITYQSAEIMKILDVQRSGQIPQLVAENGSKHVSASMRAFQIAFEQVVPSFGGHVDWYAVQSLGAIGNYAAQQAVQNEKYGKPTKLDHEEKLVEMKQKAEALQMKKAQAKFLATHLEVMPDIFIKTVERKAS